MNQTQNKKVIIPYILEYLLSIGYQKSCGQIMKDYNEYIKTFPPYLQVRIHLFAIYRRLSKPNPIEKLTKNIANINELIKSDYLINSQKNEWIDINTTLYSFNTNTNSQEDYTLKAKELITKMNVLIQTIINHLLKLKLPKLVQLNNNVISTQKRERGDGPWQKRHQYLRWTKEEINKKRREFLVKKNS